MGDQTSPEIHTANKRPVVEERRFSYKEWIGIAISCAAFALSGLTTYLSTFRTDDDVRVITASTALVRHANSADIALFVEGDWVFTNAGNRAASILGAIWILVKDSASDLNCETSDLLGVVRFNLKPFVIQPRQIEIKHVELDKGQDFAGKRGKDGTFILRMTQEFDRKSEFPVKVCLAIFLNTPDEAMKARQTIYSGRWKYDEESVDEPQPFYEKPPWVLVKKTKSTFWKELSDMFGVRY